MKYTLLLLSIGIFLFSAVHNASATTEQLDSNTATANLTFECIIPDHNEGRWGCDAKKMTYRHNSDYVTEILVFNISLDTGEFSGAARRIYKKPPAGIELELIHVIDETRNCGTYCIPLKTGVNQLEFYQYRGGSLVSKMTYNFTVDIEERF